VPRNFDFFFGSDDSLFKRQTQIVAKILAAVATAPTSSFTAEKLAEYIPEDVLKASREIKPSGERSAVTERGVPELIILSALLGIGEHLISLRDFFELFFGLLIPGIAVWMVLKGELAVGFLNIFFAHGAIDAERFIVIFLAVQNLPLDAASSV
jgi:hypothetical protein